MTTEYSETIGKSKCFLFKADVSKPTDDPDLKAYYKSYVRDALFYNMDMDYTREEGLKEGRHAAIAAVRNNLQASGYDAKAIDAILAGV